MEYSIDEIMSKGYDCLIKELGTNGMERFIAEINRQAVDYIAWRNKFFEKMEPGQFLKEAVEYAEQHPYDGQGIQI